MLQDALRVMAIAIGGVVVVATGVVVGSVVAFDMLRGDLRSLASMGQPIDVCGLAWSVPCHVVLDDTVVRRLEPVPGSGGQVEIQGPIEVFTTIPIEVTAPLGQPLSVEVENDWLSPAYVEIVR